MMQQHQNILQHVNGMPIPGHVNPGALAFQPLPLGSFPPLNLPVPPSFGMLSPTANQVVSCGYTACNVVTDSAGLTFLLPINPMLQPITSAVPSSLCASPAASLPGYSFPMRTPPLQNNLPMQMPAEALPSSIPCPSPSEATWERTPSYMPYSPSKKSVNLKAEPFQGKSVLVYHNNNFYASYDFAKKFQQRKIRKSAEVIVYTLDRTDKELCRISITVDLKNLETTKIQGQEFVPVQLLRQVTIGDEKIGYHDITQAYKKMKCNVKDAIDRNEVVFRKNSKGQHVVSQVSGELRKKGVRENMILSECLDHTGAHSSRQTGSKKKEKKSAIYLENAKSDVEYRLTFKFNMVEEMQLYQESQVFIKIQNNSCKSVLIEHWEWKVKKLDIHLKCLVKSTSQIFVFGVVLSAVDVLANDDVMNKILAVIQENNCKISDYVKGGKLKSDSANKLTLLIQAPSEYDMAHQKLTASVVWKEIHQLLEPFTTPQVTAETAEVVTLTKMASLMLATILVLGLTLEDLQERAAEGADVLYVKEFLSRLQGVGRKTLPCPGEKFEQIPERERESYTQNYARQIHEKIQNSFICDLCNQPEASENDRRVLMSGIQLLSSIIEEMIANSDDSATQYLRLILLDGFTKQDVEQMPGIYNPGTCKTWLDCFKWKFNKKEKNKNLAELEKILNHTWSETDLMQLQGRSKKTQTKQIRMTKICSTRPPSLKSSKMLGRLGNVETLSSTRTLYPNAAKTQLLEIVELAWQKQQRKEQSKTMKAMQALELKQGALKKKNSDPVPHANIYVPQFNSGECSE